MRGPLTKGNPPHSGGFVGGQFHGNPRLGCRLGMTLVLLALLPAGRASALMEVQWLPPDQVVISWPSGPQTYSLQYSTNLSEEGLWQTAIDNLVTNQDRCFVTNSVGAAPCFYRLRLNQLGAPFDPNDPAASGYLLVFHDEFNSASTIDLNASGFPGFNWYPQQFFGRPPTSSNYIKAANGELTLSGMDATSFYTLASAAPSTNAAGYVGRAWGGGAFIESRFHFDPALMNTNGWPAFWSMAIEHMARPGIADQWPGLAAGYAHFIEDDFFEYDTYAFAGARSYGAALHDWYGIWNPTTGYSNTFNQANFFVHTPAGTDFNQFHIYAQLWVPSTNGQAGYVINYFDGSPLSQVSWVGAGPGAPPPSGSSLFSIIDQEHLVLCLGTGVGEPMVFDWVRVWQFGAHAVSYAPNSGVAGRSTEKPAK
jgi:hypothetical protein